MHKIHQFSNGIRLVWQQHASVVAHFGIVVDAGTRDETADIMGMAHFIEHMLFKGTAKRKALQIISRLEEVGGELNAYTTKDKTSIYASFTREYIDRAVDLLTDAAFNSVFPEKEMEKEKKVILEEIDMYADTPEECINDEFQELVFAGHPLGYNILGTPQTVAGFTQQQSVDFVRQNYLPQNVVFSYVGPDSLEKIVAVCEKFMPAVQNGKGTKRKAFKKYTPFSTVKETEHAQCYCVMGNLAYDNTHPLKYAMLLFNNLLGGPGLNSRLNLAVRERYGYAYQVDSSYTPFEDGGFFNIYFGTDPMYLDKTITVVEKELKRLQQAELSETVLYKYKKQIAGQLLLSEESKVNLMLALGKSVLEYDRADTLEEVIEKLNAVTPGEVFEVAREVLDETKMSRLVYRSGGK